MGTHAKVFAEAIDQKKLAAANKMVIAMPGFAEAEFALEQARILTELEEKYRKLNDLHTGLLNQRGAAIALFWQLPAIKSHLAAMDKMKKGPIDQEINGRLKESRDHLNICLKEFTASIEAKLAEFEARDDVKEAIAFKKRGEK